MSYVDRIRSAEHYASDLVAECPDCSELAHPGATVCEGCAAPLYPKNNNSPGLHPLDGSAGRGMEVES